MKWSNDDHMINHGLTGPPTVINSNSNEVVCPDHGEQPCHMHWAKSCRPFELFVNENYKLRNDPKLKQHLREVRLKIPQHSPLSAEMNNASALRIGVPVMDLLSTRE